MSSRPNIPLYTIHDSFLTTPKHVMYVKKTSEEIIHKCTGWVPEMRIDKMDQFILGEKKGHPVTTDLQSRAKR